MLLIFFVCIFQKKENKYFLKRKKENGATLQELPDKS